MKIFGWEIKRKSVAPREDDFIKGQEDRGVLVVPAFGDSVFRTTAFMAEFTDEREQIESYRTLAASSYVDAALEDIITDSLNFDPDQPGIVKIKLDKTKFSAKVKKTIEHEFENVLNLLRFTKRADELFREWYVDGRHYFYLVVDRDKKKGISEIRKLDARYVKKLKKIIYDGNRTFEENLRSPKSETSFIFLVPNEADNHEYSWMSGFQINNPDAAVEITEESIAYSDSGIYDLFGRVQGPLEKAMKPYNQLAMLEDSVVIYRLTRAPERRVFYVDVADLPHSKVEEYLRGMINRFKNNSVYDETTGLIKGKYASRATVEDIWLPRREGKGTEVTSLPGGANLGEMDDVEYFKKKLYKAMGIPLSRVEAETQFSLGRSSEITRDEVKFSKLIYRLTQKFSEIFYDILKKQLILKGIMTVDEWNEEANNVDFLFESNTFFGELKKLELIKERFTILDQIDTHVGKYVSREWALTTVLNIPDADQKKLDSQIDAEIAAGKIPNTREMVPPELAGSIPANDQIPDSDTYIGIEEEEPDTSEPAKEQDEDPDQDMDLDQVEEQLV